MAILLAFAGAGLVLFILIRIFAPFWSSESQLISKLDYQAITSALSVPLAYIEDFCIEYKLLGAQPGFLTRWWKATAAEFITQLDLASLFNEVLSLTGGVLVAILSVLFITFVLLYEDQLLKKTLVARIPNAYLEMTLNALFKIEKRFRMYITGLGLQICAVFAIAFCALWMVGIPYAVNIALFAALANLIPYLGPLMGALFGIFVTLTASGEPLFSYGSLWLALKIVSVLLGVQIVDNVFFQPLIFSRSIQAHPLEVFFVILAGATLAGIWGMIVAIPLYTVLRVSVLEISTGLRTYTGMRHPSQAHRNPS